MNTATNYESTPQRSEAAELPPVQVRVPWLGASQAPCATALARTTDRPVFDRALFEPHQLVAAADMDVTDFGTVRTHWRIDPPQARPISAEIHHRPTTVASTTPSPPAKLPAALPVREVTTTASEGITHLRFDPPVTGIVEPPVQQSQPPLVTDPEPTIWHEAVTVLDQALRRYQRIIMLVALVTAAGLMLLVMDSRGPSTEAAPDSVAPNAIDVDDTAAMPLADVTHAHVPAAIPERVAMAQGPGSSRRGPSTAATDESEAPLMLEPMAPYREPTHDITPIETTKEFCEEASYPTTGDPAFELTFPTTSASELVVPRGASLSQDIRPVPQQIKQ